MSGAPEIRIEDPSSATSPQSTTTPQSARPRSVTLATPTSAATEDSDAPWRRSSIRIRRFPSNQSIATSARARRASNAENRPYTPTDRPISGQGSIIRDFGASPTSPASSRQSPITRKPIARPRAGSTNQRLRHDNRDVEIEGNRRRSSSDPLRTWNATHDGTGAPRRGDSYMPEVTEERPSFADYDRPQLDTFQNNNRPQLDTLTVPATENRTLGRRISNGLLRFPSFRPNSTATPVEEPAQQEQYEDDLVDVLDTLDPEVSTLNTLNNVQNSLFIPDLGRYLNRRPTYTLTRYPTRVTEGESSLDGEALEDKDEADEDALGRTNTLTSMTSRMDDRHFAVLPHGERLHGWSAEDRAELNDHVHYLLHSKKEKFKRSMKGFGQYVRKPLGFFVTLYATLITLFGLAWVLFLIGWINVGGRKDYIINVIDNVLVALFAVMGDGLIPFRIVDTYHMIFIAHYHHLTWRLRKERALPKLKNRNSLPDLTINDQTDIETQQEKIGEVSMLTPEQQRKLVHHQKKFSRSHTFYKPHETETHFAFPLRLLVAIVVLLDCHSCLQVALGTCTWAISYHVRPFALTTVILCCSITVNITAGILISVGDHKTRKKDVLERMFRQQLTSEAIHRLEKKKEKERRRNEGLDSVSGSEAPTPLKSLTRNDVADTGSELTTPLPTPMPGSSRNEL